MPDINSGVASASAVATASPAPAAPAQTSAPETANVSTTPESTPTGNASVATNKLGFDPKELGIEEPEVKTPEVAATTPADQVKTEGVGLRNQRAHIERLERDINEKYKPNNDRIEEIGGIDEVNNLVNFHDTFRSSDPKTFFDEGAYQVATELHKQNPANYTQFVRYLTGQHPDIALAVLQQDPRTAQLFNREGAPESEPANDAIADDDLDLTNPRDRELLSYRQEQKRARAQEQAQRQTSKQATVKEQIDGIDNGVKTYAKTELGKVAKTAGWDTERQATFYNDIIGRLKDHEKFQEHYRELCSAASQGRAPKIGTKANMDRIVNNVTASVINRETQTTRAAATTKPDAIKRIETSPASSAVQSSPMDIDLNDEGKTNAFLADLQKRFPQRNSRRAF